MSSEKTPEAHRVPRSLRDLRKTTLRSFAVGFFVAGLLLLGFVTVRDQEREGGLPRLLRASHELGGKAWSRLFDPARSPPIRGAPPGARTRLNGSLGLKSPIDLRAWRLRVYVEDKLVLTLNQDEIRWLPRTDTATEFYCVEGWSTHFSYAGVRFSEFLKAFGLSERHSYVGFETPDGEYSVSLDMQSMLHPQTLLAYEMNERPLSLEHGAPLRLVVPVKYGFKSLKRIGLIRLSDIRPKDYWAERGYDWHSGL